MIEESETFSGSWPYKARYFTGNGFRHHFVDEGTRDSDEEFVLLHGEPTWGYIFRNFVPRLSQLGRVVVPDHMGFGKSETPQDRDYSVADHCDNLDALLRSIDVQNATLVMQDWGGPIGTNFAARHPERIKRVMYIDSFPRLGIPAGIDMAELAKQGTTPWMEFFTSESFEPVMNHLNRTILSILKLVGFVNHAAISDEWLRAYASPFPTPESCKGAKAFPLDNLKTETHAYCQAAFADPAVVEALAAKPALSVMGAEDRTLPPLLAEGMFREIWPDAPFFTLPGVGHYAQEDAPETLVALILQLVQSN